MQYGTEQEEFWAQDFGDDYINRNSSKELLASNVSFFGKILQKTGQVESLIELGANIGMNLGALSVLMPNAHLSSVEINQKAAQELSARYPNAEVFNESIIDFSTDKHWDVVLVKGVLIHLNPDALPMVYNKMATIASKYVIIAEYYNPTPVTLNYRGHSDRLFKRDFAGEFLDSQRNFRLLDYGFAYHRDEMFPQDDINWFLLEKQ
jgi:spore coat polysaccharide biosynthesis protein SpsF